MEAIYNSVSALLDSDQERDYIVISHAITRPLHGALSEMLKSKKTPHTKATVFLTTYGGDPDGGYRIARCLRHHYKDGLRVVVPSWCKSAGTLIAIAADELGIGDRGELGPLDVQVFKGSELLERSSGLDIMEALGVIGNHVRWGYHGMLREARQLGLTTKLAAEMAAHIGAAVAGPLFNQVDPMRLGELQRATRIASEYGSRLNNYSQNLKDDALNQLIHGYPSHSFVIDRKEAGTLFQNVTSLTQAEQNFVDAAWNAVETQTGNDPVILTYPPKQQDTGQAHENSRPEPASANDGRQEERAATADSGDTDKSPGSVRVRSARRSKEAVGRNTDEPASQGESNGDGNILRAVSAQ